MQASRGVSLFQGLQCMESQALARANISDDTITKKKYDSDSDELEIEGIQTLGVKNTGSSKPPSLLKSLLGANSNTLQKATTASKQKTNSNFTLKKYDQDDFDLLFKKRPEELHSEEEGSEEEEIVRKPRYLPRDSEDEADFVERSNLKNAYY